MQMGITSSFYPVKITFQRFYNYKYYRKKEIKIYWSIKPGVSRQCIAIKDTNKREVFYQKILKAKLLSLAAKKIYIKLIIFV
jgi:hypothetical protein